MPILSKEDLEFCTKKIKLTDFSPTEETVEEQQPKLNPTSSMTYFHLRPKKCIDRSFESVVDKDEFIKEIHAFDGVTESLENLKQLTKNAAMVDRCNQYPKVVFLGTGSCIPNKTRNVSSILVHTT